jgi:hypothetical protein
MVQHKKNNIISENSDKPVSKKSSHYVSNPDLYNEFVLWHNVRKEAEAQGKSEPEIPNSIGKAIMLIAENFSKKYNWISNAKYRDELVGDAVVNCILYIRNFNIEKTKNPLSYFTQICYFSFLRTIEKEKLQDYVKHKSTLNSQIYQEIQNGTLDDEDLVLEDFDYNHESIEDFITSFENKKFGKKLDVDELGGTAGKTKRIEVKEDSGFL